MFDIHMFDRRSFSLLAAAVGFLWVQNASAGLFRDAGIPTGEQPADSLVTYMSSCPIKYWAPTEHVLRCDSQGSSCFEEDVLPFHLNDVPVNLDKTANAVVRTDGNPFSLSKVKFPAGIFIAEDKKKSRIQGQYIATSVGTTSYPNDTLFLDPGFSTLQGGGSASVGILFTDVTLFVTNIANDGPGTFCAADFEGNPGEPLGDAIIGSDGDPAQAIISVDQASYFKGHAACDYVSGQFTSDCFIGVPFDGDYFYRLNFLQNNFNFCKDSEGNVVTDGSCAMECRTPDTNVSGKTLKDHPYALTWTVQHGAGVDVQMFTDCTLPSLAPQNEKIDGKNLGYILPLNLEPVGFKTDSSINQGNSETSVVHGNWDNSNAAAQIQNALLNTFKHYLISSDGVFKVEVPYKGLPQSNPNGGIIFEFLKTMWYDCQAAAEAGNNTSNTSVPINRNYIFKMRGEALLDSGDGTPANRGIFGYSESKNAGDATGTPSGCTNAPEAN